MAAVGLGGTNNDIDLGKLLNGESNIQTSQVQDFISGNKAGSLFGITNAICEKPAYNCVDFKNQKEAQSVFDQCKTEKNPDIHGLDRDNDGIACQDLPKGN